MQQDNEMEAIEAQRQREAELEYELARLRRVGLFSVYVAAVMVSYLTLPFFVPLCLLVGGLIYVFGPCIYSMLFLSKEDRTSIFDQEEGWTDHTAVEDEQELGSEPVPWDQIRDCRLPRPEGKDPPEGIYRVVYAGEMFGRALRTEGELHLRWLPVAQGWEMEGFSTSAVSQRVTTRIQEGFLNSEGNLYWIPEWKSTGKKTTIYTGNFDLDKYQMHEGDFRSQDGALQGRIIRMELVKATPIALEEPTPTDNNTQQAIENDWTSTDIEMIGVTKGGDTPSVA